MILISCQFEKKCCINANGNSQSFDYIDSSRIGLRPMKSRMCVELDTSGIQNGYASIFFRDGYYLEGGYSEGLRNGLWSLYKNKNKKRKIHQYNYFNGEIMGALYYKKNKPYAPLKIVSPY